MFIRSKLVKGVRYYQVVKGERKGGKVRQSVVVSLGTNPTIEAAIEDTLRQLGQQRARRNGAVPIGKRGIKKWHATIDKLNAHATVLAKVLDQMKGLPSLHVEPDGTTGAADVVPRDPGQLPWPDADQYVYHHGWAGHWTAQRILDRCRTCYVLGSTIVDIYAIGGEWDNTKRDLFEREWFQHVPRETLDRDGVWVEMPDMSTYYLLGPTVIEAHAREWAAYKERLDGRAPKGKDPISEAAFVLGVEVPCTKAEVKAAYRKRSKTAHPDKGGSPEEFNKIRDAYETLLKMAS